MAPRAPLPGSARAQWRVRKNLEGQQYENFLKALLASQDYFGLVWRDGTDSADLSRSIRLDLGPLQVEHYRSSKWPSASLKEGTAAVHVYRCTERALPALLAPGALYAWDSPLPQDLHFWSKDHGLAFFLISSWSDARVVGARSARLLSNVVPLERD